MKARMSTYPKLSQIKNIHESRAPPIRGFFFSEDAKLKARLKTKRKAKLKAMLKAKLKVKLKAKLNAMLKTRRKAELKAMLNTNTK